MGESIDTIVSLNSLFAVNDRCLFLSLEIISWHAHPTDITTLNTTQRHLSSNSP